MDPFTAKFTYKGEACRAHVMPSNIKREDGTPATYQIVMDRQYVGDIYCDGMQWKINSPQSVDQALIDIIGDLIFRFMQ